MKRSDYASFIPKGVQPVGGGHNRTPDRQPLKLGSDAPFFKDGKLNRDPHAAPSGPAVIPSEAKVVHVFHHGKDESQ